jgi:hypothetical protein
VDNIADLATEAAAAAGGYLAAIAGKVADKVKDGAAERLYSLIESRLRGTISGTTALDSLREQPQALQRQKMVAAVLQDIAAADPGFAQQLAELVPAVASISAPRWTGTHVQVSGSRLNRSQVAGGDIDNSKRTLRIGTGGFVFGGLALMALLTGAGVLGAQIGSTARCSTGASPAAGLAEPDISDAAKPDQERDWRLLPTTPNETVRMVYKGIAEARDSSESSQGSIERTCLFMSDQARRKFAADLGYPDCQTAVPALGREVTSLNSYVESLPPSEWAGNPKVGDRVTVDSCASGVKGGRALGVFIVQNMFSSHWLIVGHQPGPRVC